MNVPLTLLAILASISASLLLYASLALRKTKIALADALAEGRGTVTLLELSKDALEASQAAHQASANVYFEKCGELGTALEIANKKISRLKLDILNQSNSINPSQVGLKSYRLVQVGIDFEGYPSKTIVFTSPHLESVIARQTVILSKGKVSPAKLTIEVSYDRKWLPLAKGGDVKPKWQDVGPFVAEMKIGAPSSDILNLVLGRRS